MPLANARSHPPAGPHRTALSGMDELPILHAVGLGRMVAGVGGRARPVAVDIHGVLVDVD
jgi:hypothetical protein